jgi:hypothetical protein
MCRVRKVEPCQFVLMRIAGLSGISLEIGNKPHGPRARHCPQAVKWQSGHLEKPLFFGQLASQPPDLRSPAFGNRGFSRLPISKGTAWLAHMVRPSARQQGRAVGGQKKPGKTLPLAPIGILYSPLPAVLARSRATRARLTYLLCNIASSSSSNSSRSSSVSSAFSTARINSSNFTCKASVFFCAHCTWQPTLGKYKALSRRAFSE